MTDNAIELHDLAEVGRNDWYRFVVARIGCRWAGGAISTDPPRLFVFPEVAQDYHLGVLDRTRAILLTGALAQDPEGGWGGIDQWAVAPELRGDPEQFRCASCDRVGCPGDCEEETGEEVESCP